MLARPSLGWALSVALVDRGASFQLVGSPLGSVDGRGSTTAAKFEIHHFGHARPSVVRSDDSSSGESGFRLAGRDQHGRGEEDREEQNGNRPLLMDYFVRHGIESAEIVPAMESDYLPGGVETPDGVVFVKTIIFQADGKPFAAVMREDLVADRARMARHLRLTSRQVTLPKAPYVEDVTGFPVGTIPPLGHRTRVPTLVDAELLKYSTVVGGAGLRGFDSRLSVRDLLKATGASVIPLARSRRDGDGRDVMNAESNGRGRGGNGGDSEKAPMLSWYSSTATIPTSGRSTGLDAGEEIGEEIKEGGDVQVAGAEAPPQRGAMVPGTHLGRTNNSSPLLGRGGGAGEISTARKAVGDADAEARHRIIAAAMHVVAAALSALATFQDAGGSALNRADGGANRDGGDFEGAGWFPEMAEGSAAVGGIRVGGSVINGDRGGGGHCDSVAASTAVSLSVGQEGENETAADPFYSPDKADGDVGEPGGPASQEAAAHAAATAADAVGAGAAAEPAVAYGREFARAAGTPTVDAIGGDVHLVAIVAGKRSLTRLLHFVDLVPPADEMSVSNQTCLVKKAWMVPGMGQAHPSTPVKVQVIMGKTLVDRLGQQDALIAMRGVKRGQLLYITGRPTPDTRKRFLGDASSATPVYDTDEKYGGSGNGAAVNGSLKIGSNKVETYDLVCCSVRLLEDAPLVDPGLVGKGDEWLGGGDYLKMDLEESAVTYVDSAKKLKEMGEFLRQTLLDDPAAAAAAAASTASAAPGAMAIGGGAPMPALAVDCEWRPSRVAGTPANPVCVMQLAAGERVFVVDMLHVCRPKSAASLTAAAMGETSSGLTKTEGLLEEALGAVLGSTGVVKVGLGPKADFQSLVRSYPHIPCFHRVCGVVNLCHMASNASSLRGKPAEEKASLSRLCNLVLGKPLDKSEQCSDWGTRPLSGRQKRYAALDARATLLVHRHLAPQVSPERMESLFNTFAYDHQTDGMSATQTLPSTQWALLATRGRAARQQSEGARGRGGGRRGTGRTRKLRAGGSRQERMLRKQLLGVTMINVAEVQLDAEGLRNNWLGRALPGLTKEGAVRACIFPRGEMPTSGELPTVLRFDRHQSFVEFGNGYALLMNCGAPVDREHASGFLDEDGSTAAWYLQGRLSSSDAAFVDGEAAEYQRQRQAWRGPAGAPTARAPQGTAVDGDVTGAGGDAIGKFLQRLAEASGTPSSMLGGLPEDDPPALLEPSSPRLWANRSPLGGGGVGGGISGVEPHLVLFARAKGRPYVYCGVVDCVAQEYVWSAGSSVGAVRFTLALREWREAAAATIAPAASVASEGAGQRRSGCGCEETASVRGAPSAGGGGRFEFDMGGAAEADEGGRGVYGGGNAFAGLVEEGLRPPPMGSTSTP